MTVLIAAAKDLRDRLGLLGFPLIGDTLAYEVGIELEATDARDLLAEGERLATRLQGYLEKSDWAGE